MLEAAAKTEQDVVFYEKNKPVHLSYNEALIGAKALAGHITGWGVKPGDKVLILLNASIDFFECFYGVIYAGGVPCVLPDFTTIRVKEERINKTKRIAQQLNTNKVIANAFSHSILKELQEELPLDISTVEQLRDVSPASTSTYHPQLDDIAVIQATSGSTGSPKCVMLSHRNLLSNLEQLKQGLQADERDVIVSWLPLFHDMGLIGCFLLSIYQQGRCVLMTPSQFLKRPFRWLKAISEYGGTLSPAPNFAYAYCCTRIKKNQIADLDLSTWRSALCGSEMVDADTLREFAEYFAGANFSARSLTPCYGMAEACLGITMHAVDSALNTVVISRSQLSSSGALCAPKSDADSMEVVDCGIPLLETEIRVVSDNGKRLPTEKFGRIQVKSPSIMQGYFSDEKRSTEAFVDGWLDTGDLGFLKHDHLYITGRTKDLIIIRGEKYLPSDFETAALTVNYIKEGKVAAFGVYNSKLSSEEIYIVAEIKGVDGIDEAGLKDEIAQKVSASTGVLPAHIGFVPNGTIPKTTSGKLQRNHMRKIYLEILNES